MDRNQVRVGGVTVELSRPEKPLFPDDGITKGDLVDFYRDVGRHMLVYLRERPITMERYPDGIADRAIIHKDAPDYFPEWIRIAAVQKQGGGTVDHVICDRVATLVYLANQACITPHVFLSRVDRIDHPDEMVFDLDPPEGAFTAARRTALLLRDLLEAERDVVAYAKTSGGKGVHVHVPLDRRANFDEVRTIARHIADTLADRHPDQITTEQRIAKRGERVFIDVLRNSYAQTVVPPYAVRARPGAPVATPLHWDEVEDTDLDPRGFALRNTLDRLNKTEDPWHDMRRRARSVRQAE
jgi:bifunctional non-homologous end joining protein LigD